MWKRFQLSPSGDTRMRPCMDVVAPITPAQAACPVPPGAVKIAVPSGLPTALSHALPGDIALPGEPFDSTDVYVKGTKHRRYIFVWNFGTRGLWRWSKAA